jgi:tRNASer (uridine44-2'-O)-methyltransferase
MTLVEEDNPGEVKGMLRAPWSYILSNPASYPPEIFAQVGLELIFHPERNSKHIRRADILADSATDIDVVTVDGDGVDGDVVDGMFCTRTIRRRLMPRNPNLDGELEQSCRLYVVEGETCATLVTYHCYYVEEVGVPYYFPDVLGVAFELYGSNISLAYLPLPGKVCTNDRLQRVAFNLLQTLHRHWYHSCCLADVVSEHKMVIKNVFIMIC